MLGKVVGKTSYKLVSKPWGWEKWIWNDDRYCGKLLFIAKDHRCSWHYHKVKDETFYVQQGECSVTYGFNDNPGQAETTLLKQGDVFHVPTELRHQMFGETDVLLFEFSTPHSDEDSIRLIPGY